MGENTVRQYDLQNVMIINAVSAVSGNYRSSGTNCGRDRRRWREEWSRRVEVVVAPGNGRKLGRTRKFHGTLCFFHTFSSVLDFFVWECCGDIPRFKNSIHVS